ncbi:hypothetical protein DM01DRAFT_1298333, partial [Hesseltinella vesiculosa]
MVDLQGLANGLTKCFSDFYIQSNDTMKQFILKAEQGCVSFDDIMTIAPISKWNPTVNDIEMAVQEHCENTLLATQTGVQRIKPFIDQQTIEQDDWSILVEGLPKKYDTKDRIQDLFTQHVGPVAFLRFPPDRQGKEFFQGLCFIEFQDKQYVQQAIDMFDCFDLDTLSFQHNPASPIQHPLRVMSKHDWNAMKEAYLKLQEQEADFIKSLWNDHIRATNKRQTEEDKQHATPAKKTKREEILQEEAAAQPAYPEHVVVTVEHIHPKTSKTALKAILEQSGASVAFVKYKKGLVQTNVRMTTPEDTDKLVTYFQTHHLVQETAQDTKGSAKDAASFETLSVRAIQGQEEKIYWESESWHP